MNSESECKEDGFLVSLRGSQTWPPKFHIIKVSELPENDGCMQVGEMVEVKNEQQIRFRNSNPK